MRAATPTSSIPPCVLFLFNLFRVSLSPIMLGNNSCSALMCITNMKYPGFILFISNKCISILWMSSLRRGAPTVRTTRFGKDRGQRASVVPEHAMWPLLSGTPSSCTGRHFEASRISKMATDAAVSLCLSLYALGTFYDLLIGNHFFWNYPLKK